MQLVTDGHPALSTKSTNVEPGDLQMPGVIETMIRVCQGRGVGLAANQVGVTKRAIIINTKKTRMVMINPVIIKTKGHKHPSFEGCLSFPDLGKVERKRYKNVWVDYENEVGATSRKKLTGLDAIVAQHEIDHLDGITIADEQL